jgi:hypothetical protein
MGFEAFPDVDRASLRMRGCTAPGPVRIIFPLDKRMDTTYARVQKSGRRLHSRSLQLLSDASKQQCKVAPE